MKISIKDIREFFWPLLEGENASIEKVINTEDIKVEDSLLKEILEYSIQDYNDQIDSVKSIEFKSSLFISTISVSTAVLIAISTYVVKESQLNIHSILFIFLTFILILYMSRTVWFSIQALERRRYYRKSIDDFLSCDKQVSEYYKEMIVKVSNCVLKNRKTVNSKVDSMAMAQEYFKRSIVVIAFYSLLILVQCLFKINIDFISILSKIVSFIKSVNIEGWNFFAIYVLLATSIVLSVISLKRSKNNNV